MAETLVWRRAAVTQAVLLGMQGAVFGFLPAYLLTAGSGHGLWLWGVAAPGVLVSMLSFALAAWHVAGAETVKVEGTSLLVRRSVGPLSLSRAYSLGRPVDVAIVEYTPSSRLNDTWGVGQPHLRLQGPGGRVELGLALSSSEAEVAAEELRALLNNPIGTPSNNEMQRTKPAQALELRR